MVALVAATAATMFQRPAERDAAAGLATSTNHVASPGRGQIVPLVVAEGRARALVERARRVRDAVQR